MTNTEPSPTPNELAPGTILQGTYRIAGPLAEGGCGEIYLADHTRLPGRVAIKVLHRGLQRNAEVLSRFRQEAEITATLRHPHIVQVLDFNVTDQGYPYLVMELLEGQPLARRIAGGQPLRPAAAVNIVEQIAQALQAAHARGIVHRDLKPDNIMLLQSEGLQDFVKVLDFGISQASWRPRLTNGAEVAGTPQYMAPEQACGQRDAIEPRTDQFSLAAIAYTLLTGQEPFVAEDPIAVLYQVVHADPVPPAALVPRLGPAVDAVIMRGLAKSSAERFPNVLEFAGALRRAVEATATPAPVRIPPPASEPAPLDEPPPVRAFQPGLFDPERAALATASPEEPLEPAGRPTRRLIRRVRWRMYRTPRRLALLALAGAMAFAWFSPTARGTAETMWRHAQAEAQRLAGPRLP
ncbi:MAG TPA: serine/threonine-protein kinase [Polyangia bacterium]|nr:serine/threonine-protein kinase [Polyangia bacterium]